MVFGTISSGSNPDRRTKKKLGFKYFLVFLFILIHLLLKCAIIFYRRNYEIREILQIN